MISKSDDVYHYKAYYMKLVVLIIISAVYITNFPCLYFISQATLKVPQTSFYHGTSICKAF